MQRTLTFWTVSRHAIGLAQYPFGPSDRVEFSAGFQRVSFHAETDERVFNPFTGEQLAQESRDAPACGDSLSIRRDLCRPEAMNEFRGTAALVHDRTVLGPTGPLAGSRYRFEASPSFGTLNYVSVLGDWRGYQRLAGPVTFALRGLHFGRYLEDAEDERLTRLFLGYPSLIRGYDDGSFSLTRCPTDEPLETCSEVTVFDRLFGSRLAVANAELRLSLFGPVGVLGYSFLPADLIGFFDAGLAWANDQPSTANDERAWFLGGDRKPLTSAGAGIRINLLGFALGELYWVKPFQRSLRNGYFHFTLSTGF
ncbi:MAG: BamA/TamA family outer membrane protein [Gemmatimonadales bacterium]